MLARIKDEGDVSYQRFTDAAELQLLDENDLAVLLSERFSLTQTQGGGIPGDAVPAAGALPVPPTPDRRPRPGFAQRIGVDERTLADTPVLDPARTVRTDVERVLWAEEIPQDVRVSGHVYDLGTGLVTTIVDAKSRK